VAGVLQHGDLALWCIPVFVIFGAIANTANQEAKRIAKGAAESPTVAPQVGEGILGTFLVLVLLALIVIGYFFYMISWLHG
jgi:predicted secreted protein